MYGRLHPETMTISEELFRHLSCQCYKHVNSPGLYGILKARSAIGSQVMRRPRVTKCCIPSYTLDELLRYCTHFNVPREMLEKASLVKSDDIDRFIIQGVSGSPTDISACLLVASVEEEKFLDDEDQAYLSKNVLWTIASQLITKIMKSIQGTAISFVRNFITRWVNSLERAGRELF